MPQNYEISLFPIAFYKKILKIQKILDPMRNFFKKELENLINISDFILI